MGDDAAELAREPALSADELTSSEAAERTDDTSPPARPVADPEAGQPIIAADAVGTALFAITAEISALTFAMWAQWLAAITALALFAIGVFSFLIAHLRAVNRSRDEQIGVLEVFLLAGPAVPRTPKWRLLGLLAAQVAIAIVTTFQRPNGADGKPGTSLALGFLVAMFGLGLNGLWASAHGVFPPRRRRTP